MKEDFLKQIADKAYAISYAANLNFATYDIVTKAPGRIAFLTIVAGILGLGWPELTARWLSVVILIFGVANVYIRKFTSDIASYKNRGIKNTEQWNKLRGLYVKVKSLDDDADFSSEINELSVIELEFNDGAEPDQIVFSNWFAHFKLFCEKDVSWMDEQLHFGLWKDKIPQTAKACLVMLVIAIVVYYCIAVPQLNSLICKLLFIEK